MKASAYLLLMTSFVSFSAFSMGGNNVDDNQQLLESCQALTANPEQDSAQSCRYYLQGVLTGAFVTDNEIATTGGGKQSAFVERAYRTRIGKTESGPSESFRLFCETGDESQRRIANIVSKQLSLPAGAAKTLTTQIYKALKPHYPCE
ncbi:Rap1a/Tai family immunity protein [Motiliproteus sp. MSK22-1]|uniref:Rap1a/Tai family immunity protein n=1 Tax=Motiliproteus sp. MSK22-1 TaxID=1897630 RepID=UPI000977ECE0|nr:Rap1a/Tai family immunity protein [Motiliproteus sp. MSK22-1]OMH32695.1 hypothetical protein BGP75_14260 [Motiliproteus sp. MSK22-1]